MDPNANLAELRRLAQSMMDAWDDADEETGETHVDPDDAIRLGELVQALDGWISGGGFLPEDWRSK